METVLDRDLIREASPVTRHLNRLASGARDVLYDRPVRWAETHPRSTLGIVGGLGIAVGVTLGVLFSRR